MIKRKDAFLSQQTSDPLMILAVQCQKDLLLKKSANGSVSCLELMEAQFSFLRLFEEANIPNHSDILSLYQLAKASMEECLDPPVSCVVIDSLKHCCYKYSEVQGLVDSSVLLAGKGYKDVRC